MQTLTTHLNAIEKHEKHLDRLVLVSNDKDHELLGMISHKKSQITIFGHKHKIKNFIKKFDIFH